MPFTEKGKKARLPAQAALSASLRIFPLQISGLRLLFSQEEGKKQ